LKKKSSGGGQGITTKTGVSETCQGSLPNCKRKKNKKQKTKKHVAANTHPEPPAPLLLLDNRHRTPRAPGIGLACFFFFFVSFIIRKKKKKKMEAFEKKKKKQGTRTRREPRDVLRLFVFAEQLRNERLLEDRRRRARALAGGVARYQLPAVHKVPHPRKANAGPAEKQKNQQKKINTQARTQQKKWEIVSENNTTATAAAMSVSKGSG
jgi:hypothetical protein